MRDYAYGQACVCCGAKDGTVVAAHYQGYRSYLMGKGKASKPHDLFVAYFCSDCHAKFDGYDTSDLDDKWLRKIDHSEQFMYYILKTLMVLYKQGHLKIE